MKVNSTIVTLAALMLSVAATARSQSAITTVSLGRDQIGRVNTGLAITTRIAFPEEIKEVICGDLYDPASGRGNFVVQRSDNDLFLKPTSSGGMSNLFVKTGKSGEYVYSFDLSVVPAAQAHRIINVVNGYQRTVEAKQAAAVAKRTRTLPSMDAIEISNSLLETMTSKGAETTRLILAGIPFSSSLPAPDGQASVNAGMIGAIESMPRQPIKRIKPLYPEPARRAGVLGDVLVEVMINDAGKVTAVKAITGPELLREAAVVAARSWRFEPSSSLNRDKSRVERITFKFINDEKRVSGNVLSNGGQRN